MSQPKQRPLPRVRAGSLIPKLFVNQTFGQCDQLRLATIRLPGDTTIRKHTADRAFSAPAQRFNSIANVKVSSLTETLNDLHHSVSVKDTGNVVRDRRCGFPQTGRRQFGKDGCCDAAAYIRKRVAIEKQEGRLAMTMEKKIDCFSQS